MHACFCLVRVCPACACASPKVAPFLEARVELAVKAMATLTAGARTIASNTDEVKRAAGHKLLQLERNLESATKLGEGVRSREALKDRALSDLEKRCRTLEAERGALESQLKLLRSGEGTRLGDLQRMVEAQALELSGQEASLAEATRHWMNHETATDALQETTQKLISVVTSALAEEPMVRDQELNGLLLVGPTDLQVERERRFEREEKRRKLICVPLA